MARISTGRKMEINGQPVLPLFKVVFSDREWATIWKGFIVSWWLTQTYSLYIAHWVSKPSMFSKGANGVFENMCNKKNTWCIWSQHDLAVMATLHLCEPHGNTKVHNNFLLPICVCNPPQKASQHHSKFILYHKKLISILQKWQLALSLCVFLEPGRIERLVFRSKVQWSQRCLPSTTWHGQWETWEHPKRSGPWNGAMYQRDWPLAHGRDPLAKAEIAAPVGLRTWKMILAFANPSGCAGIYWQLLSHRCHWRSSDSLVEIHEIWHGCCVEATCWWC